MPLPLILGAIGLGGSILSGILGAGAAKKAARIQADAAAAAGRKVEEDAARVNPLITAAAGEAGAEVTRQAGQAGAGVAAATDRANALLDPYRVAGEHATDLLDQGLAEGGRFNRMPTMEDIQIDPAYAWLKAEGQTTMERSAAARGGAASGTALMGLANYSYNVGSQEFSKAFERFRQSRQDMFGNLNTVAGRGRDVAGEAGGNLIGSGKYSGDITTGAARYSGDKTAGAAVQTGANTLDASRAAAEFLTQGANARAGGVIGRTNAITGAISSGLGAVTSAGNLYAYMKRTAAMGAPKVGYA